MSEEKKFIFGPGGKSKIVSVKAARSWYEKGWADSPAAFLDLEEESEELDDSSFSEDPFKKKEKNESDVIVEPNFKAMSKEDLIIFAKVDCDIDLPNHWNKSEMIKEIQSYRKTLGLGAP